MDTNARLQPKSACLAVDHSQHFFDRVPMLTLLVAAIAVLIQASSAWADRMTFDRAMIAGGEHWRLVTGHLTHWNADHLLWDVAMFVVLGAMIELRNATALWRLLAASIAAISFAVWFAEPGIHQYRGLSGVDSALFAFAALVLFDDARQAKQRVIIGALAALALAFVAKLLWETATGATLFVDSLTAQFTPLPSVHAVGGLAGALVWWTARAKD
jgi:rhomboid family GlyGly-CTERM serine protease